MYTFMPLFDVVTLAYYWRPLYADIAKQLFSNLIPTYSREFASQNQCKY